MNIYAVIGFKEEVQPTSLLLQYLKEANIRLCLVNSCDYISSQLIVE